MVLFSKRQQMIGLLGWFCFCFIVAGLGAMASVQAKLFYAQLEQPSWAPPAWLFGPVWTVLYALMAISVWLIWRHGGFRLQRVAISIFIIQLGLNGLWSWLFFAWHFGFLAFFDICLLWVMIVTTLVVFWRTKPIAALLLLPYFVWVSFALVLNFSIWQLNVNTLG